MSFEGQQKILSSAVYSTIFEPIILLEDCRRIKTMSKLGKPFIV